MKTNKNRLTSPYTLFLSLHPLSFQTSVLEYNNLTKYMLSSLKNATIGSLCFCAGPPSSDRRPGSHQTSTADSQDPSFDPNQRRFNQSQQSRGRGGFRRGFHGGGPHFSGSHDGQSTQRPPPHTGPSNGTSFLQPSRFSGPGFRMSSGQSPRFSGPPNQMGFQPQAFSGRGRMPAHQQQAFSGPGNGMPPYQLPPFSGPNGGMHSHPPRMFWGTNNNNNNNNNMQPPPVFSGHSQQRPPFGQWAPNPPY